MPHRPSLYGVTHSPWVQGAWFALSVHHPQMPLTSLPPSLAWWWSRGLVFPVYSPREGPPIADSFEIYRHLSEEGHPIGWESWSPEDRATLQRDLERLFLSYAFRRALPGRSLAFLRGWASMGEHPASFKGTLFRAFLSVYFLVLIKLALFTQRKRSFYTVEAISGLLSRWDDKLASQPYLTGESIGFADYALFGHLQCMCSGLTDELLPLIEGSTHLRSWTDRVAEHLPGHLPDFTRRLHTQRPVNQAPDHILFWCAFAFLILCWPLTVLALLLSFLRRSQNPARSGAKVRAR